MPAKYTNFGSNKPTISAPKTYQVPTKIQTQHLTPSTKV